MNEPLSAPRTLSGMTNIFACLLVTVLAMIVFTPLILRMSASAYDYIVHTNLAIKMLNSQSLSSPHFLLHASIVALQKILPISFKTASSLVVLFSMGGTAFLLFKIMRTVVQSLWQAGILTLCLMLVAPIPLLAPVDGKLYFGYIASNVFHNPTILLLKPFSLLVFAFIFIKKAGDADPAWKSLVVCILATTACALAKPNYIIVIVPALVIAFALPPLRNVLRENVRLIFFGIFLPALIILVGQYWVTYSAEQLPGLYQGKSGIVVAPLVVMSSASSWLLAKFFLSIAFPLAVCVGYYRQVLSHPRLLLAWLAFFVGAGYTYLLAESGARMYQGNFGWSSQIALFILFAVSMEFLCERARLDGLITRSRKIAFSVCLTFFVLHTLSGINFYLAQYMAGDYCK